MILSFAKTVFLQEVLAWFVLLNVACSVGRHHSRAKENLVDKNDLEPSRSSRYPNSTHPERKNTFAFNPVQQVRLDTEASQRKEEQDAIAQRITGMMDDHYAAIERNFARLLPPEPVLFSVSNDKSMSAPGIFTYSSVIAGMPAESANHLAKTGYFVAPSPGLYLFLFSSRHEEDAPALVVIKKNDVIMTGSFASKGSFGSFNIQTIIAMCQGDEVHVALAEGTIWDQPDRVYLIGSFTGYHVANEGAECS